MKLPKQGMKNSEVVAPLAGAWIEMCDMEGFCINEDGSLPSRERGLKYQQKENSIRGDIVAPLAGAWIEMIMMRELKRSRQCRSPRGSVD